MDIKQKTSKKLIIAFDINKTIIVDDKIAGKDQAKVLNEILSDVSWGNLSESGEWIWDGSAPCTREKRSNQNSISYTDYIWDKYPDVAGGDLRQIKKQRDSLRTNFTEPNQPGEKLRVNFENLEKGLELHIDPSKQEEAKIAGLDNKNSVQIVQALFEFMLRAKQEQLDFSLQFRTFGNDIVNVAKEFNAFCEGKHPCYAGARFDGTDGSQDYRIHLEPEGNQFGTFYRSTKGIYFIKNTLNQPKDDQDFEQNFLNTSNNNSENSSGEQYEIIEGVKSFYDYLQQNLHSKQRTVYCRDYYQFWRENLEMPFAGKLLPVDQSANNDTHTIFFDDNVDWNDAHIIDARDVHTGAPIDFSLTQNINLFKVEPLEFLQQPKSYYYDLVQQSLNKLQEKDEKEGKI